MELEEKEKCTMCEKELKQRDLDRVVLIDLRHVFNATAEGFDDLRTVTSLSFCKPTPENTCLADYMQFSIDHFRNKYGQKQQVKKDKKGE